MAVRSSTAGIPVPTVSGDPTLTVLRPSSRPLVEAAQVVLSTVGLPSVALVGGLAVTTRLSQAGLEHRATTDIDFVTDYADSDVDTVELIASTHRSDEKPLVVQGVKVDIIPTGPVTDQQIDELDDDGQRLFIGAHRWAYETATPERLTVPGSDLLDVVVATPAGLVAAKSHALGFPRAARRAEKHSSDLLDVYRLIDRYGADGTLADELVAGPAHAARIVADVLDREILANPAAVAGTMVRSSPLPIDVDDLTSVVGDFVADLRR